jgi:DNA mismatch repair protein MutS
LKHLENVHVSASEVNGEIVFLHKVKKGAIDRSYGINVAKLASLPTDVIIRANDILSKLEKNELIDTKKLSIKNYVAPLVYDSKSDLEVYILKEIKDLNVYEMTPMDAMNKLNELKNKLK